MDYYSKYLKYKSKYTEMKKQLGGISKAHANLLKNAANSIAAANKKHTDEITKIKKNMNEIITKLPTSKDKNKLVMDLTDQALNLEKIIYEHKKIENRVSNTLTENDIINYIEYITNSLKNINLESTPVSVTNITTAALNYEQKITNNDPWRVLSEIGIGIDTQVIV
jgi:hypothetical protein